ncbi:MAG TPA: hypothetical protein VH835_13310 [Dongiaceae bacterium]|jgi:GST-like protein
MYTLYGKPGWGSVIVEAQLELAGLPFKFEEVDPLENARTASGWRSSIRWRSCLR